jgi:hypothetical protein
MKRKYTNRLINITEPYKIGNVIKTAFYTEKNCNFEVNDRVFIYSGAYDSNIHNITVDFEIDAEGYKVLFVDKCKVVLDIDYTGIAPYITLPEEDYYRIYNISTQREFDYINSLDIVINDNGIPTRMNRFVLFDTNGDPLNRNIIYASLPLLNSNTTSTDTIKNHDGLVGNGVDNIGFAYRDYNATTWTADSNYINDLPDARFKIYGDSILLPSGQILHSGVVYKYNYTTAQYEEDLAHCQPIITRLVFRGGAFKGRWNDGLFGVYERRSIWDYPSAKWNSGFMLNTDWEDGVIGDKSRVIDISYYAQIGVNGKVITTTDNSNNLSFGYNTIVDSHIKKGVVENGIFERCTIDTVHTDEILDLKYSGQAYDTYSADLIINGGKFTETKLENVTVHNATVQNSTIENAYLDNCNVMNSKVVDSYMYESNIGELNNAINVLDTDVWGYQYTAGKIIGIMKLYIPYNDFIKFDNLDTVYVTYLNKEWVINNLDIKLEIPLEDKYYLDNYVKDGKTYLVKINNPLENEYQTRLTSLNIPTSDSDISVDFIDNPIKYYSIDIELEDFSYVYVQNTDSYYRYNDVYTPSNFDFTSFKKFKNSKIDTLDIDYSLVEASNWKFGSYINEKDSYIGFDTLTNEYAIEWDNADSVIELTLINDEIIPLTLQVGKYIYLNNIQYHKGVDTFKLDSGFRVVDIIYNLNDRTVKLEPLGDVSFIDGTGYLSFHFLNNNFYNETNPTYVSIDTVLIKNSEITGGYLSNVALTGSRIINDAVDKTEQLFIQNRVKNIIFKDNENVINGGIVYHSHFFDSEVSNRTQTTGGTIYKSVFYRMYNNGTTLKNIYWLNSILEDGKIETTKNYDLTALYFDNIPKREILDGGIINGGIVTTSILKDITFNDGVFHNGEFWSGEVYGGVMGDNNLSYDKTLIGNIPFLPYDNLYTLDVVWDGGTVINAKVGGYGRVGWFNGTFENGVFTTNTLFQNLFGNYSIWLNGKFNGGTINGAVKWKNGIFKNGKFLSVYKTNNSVVNSTNPADYAWENGIFYGEIFGTGDINLANNSSWFTGKMYGGLFQGSVWNYGILYSGKFKGSGLRLFLETTDTTIYTGIDATETAQKRNTATDELNELKTVLENETANFFKPKAHKVSVTSSIDTYPNNIHNKHSLWYSKYFVNSYVDNFYGLWKGGIICDDEYYGDINSPYSPNNEYHYTNDIDGFRVEMSSVLFMDTKIKHQNNNIEKSVFLKGQIDEAMFTDVVFNPYVDRSMISNDNPDFVYNNEAIIKNTVLNGGIYYISDIINSTINHGVYNGITADKSTFNYSWSNNVYWKESKWNNGNWDGSPFSTTSLLYDDNGDVIYDNDAPLMDDFTTKIIEHVNDKKQLDNIDDNGLIHINNHITNDNFTLPSGSDVYPFSNNTIVDMYLYLGGNHWESTSYSLSSYQRRGITDVLTHRREWEATNPNLHIIDIFEGTMPMLGTAIPKSIKGFRLISQSTIGIGITHGMLYNNDSSNLTERNLQIYRQIEYEGFVKNPSSVLDPGKPIIRLKDNNIITSNSSDMVINNVYYESPRVAYGMRNLTFRAGGNLTNPLWDFTEFRSFSSYNKNYSYNNAPTYLFRPQSIATNNSVTGFGSFTQSDVFRIGFTEFDTGLEIKFHINAKLRYAISHSRPILSTVRQPITTRIIAGRKLDMSTNNIVLNQVLDTFIPDDWDWVGDREISLEYKPVQYDIYKADASSEHSTNVATNNASMAAMYAPFNYWAVLANNAGDFDKELTVDVYTNDSYTNVLLNNAWTNNYEGSKLYDIFNVYILSLKVATSVANYSPVNNTLWESYDSVNDTWLLPPDTIPSFNTTSIKVINNVKTIRNEVANLKFGNGRFMSGIWVHGAWNQGWRGDNVIKFYPSLTAVQNDVNEWYLEIPVCVEDNIRLDELKIGDKISISNIIGIDKNNERVQLTNYALLSEKTEDSIIVRVNSPVELVTIKPDSDIHLIYVTRNVWLNGVFFNGHFSGIFSYGMVKGFAYITKLENTHMINGVFDGGHFVSNTDNVNDRYKIAVLLKNSTLKQEYNVSLIQHFTFYDNNYANTNRFAYDSWIDLAYDRTHKSTFLSDRHIMAGIGDNVYYPFHSPIDMKVADMNGFIISDILSSTSYLRETESQNIIKHNLGTKFKVLGKQIPTEYSSFEAENNIFMDTNANNIIQGINDAKWNVDIINIIRGNQVLAISNPYGLTDAIVLFPYKKIDFLPSPAQKYTNVLYLFNNEYYVCFESNTPTSTFGWEWAKVKLKLPTEPYYPSSFKFGTNFSTLPTNDGIDIISKSYNQAKLLITKNTNDIETKSFIKINNDNVIIEKKKYTVVKLDVLKTDYIPSYYYNMTFAPPIVGNMDYHSNYENEKWYVVNGFLYLPTALGGSYQPNISLGYIPSIYSLNQELPLNNNDEYLERTTETNYEYFYNKTDLDLIIIGQTRNIDFSSIEMDEVDMIPFPRYTIGEYAEIGVNKSISVEWLGIANENYIADMGVLGNNNFSRNYLNETNIVEIKLPKIYSLLPYLLHKTVVSRNKI